MKKIVVFARLWQAEATIKMLSERHGVGQQAVDVIDAQIEHLIIETLKKIKCNESHKISCKEGKAVLIFDHAREADHFAEAFHEIADAEVNKKTNHQTEQRYFCVGISHGMADKAGKHYINVDQGFSECIASKAREGEILIESSCCAHLARSGNKSYGRERVIVCEKANKRESVLVRARQVSVPPKSRLRSAEPWLGRVSMICGLLGISLISLFQWLFPTQPFSIEVRADHLGIKSQFDVKSKRGDVLWTGSVAGSIESAFIEDLVGNKKREIVVGIGDGGSDTGKVLIFNHKGKLIHTCETTPPSPYRDQFTGKYSVIQCQAADLFHDGKKEIVTISREASRYLTSQVAIFDPQGKLLKLFWNPGIMDHLLIGSESLGSPTKIIVSCVNNSFSTGTNDYRECLFMLDPKKMPERAEAPLSPTHPMLGGEWYGMFCPQGAKTQSLKLAERGKSGFYDIVVELAGHFVYINFRGIKLNAVRINPAAGPIDYIKYTGGTNLCE